MTGRRIGAKPRGVLALAILAVFFYLAQYLMMMLNICSGGSTFIACCVTFPLMELTVTEPEGVIELIEIEPAGVMVTLSV